MQLPDNFELVVSTMLGDGVKRRAENEEAEEWPLEKITVRPHVAVVSDRRTLSRDLATTVELI